MPRRDIVTEKLADVIQTVQLAGRTGELSVERGEEGTPSFEEGSIIFIKGKVASAHTRYQSGPAAFNWLMGWGTCRFAFIPSTVPASPPSMPARAPSTTRTFVRIPLSQPGISGTIPHRLSTRQDILEQFPELGLTRHHRRLFLLIDGHRTITELVTLMKQKPQDIYSMLSDLEKNRLIEM